MNTRKSHFTTNLTQEICWEGENRRVTASAWVRKCSRLNRIQGLYEFLGKGVDLFRVEIGEISCSEIGLFTL